MKDDEPIPQLFYSECASAITFYCDMCINSANQSRRSERFRRFIHPCGKFIGHGNILSSQQRAIQDDKITHKHTFPIIHTIENQAIQIQI